MHSNKLNPDNQLRDIYNITRLNREVRAILEGSFPMIWVQGEISNLAQPASGHMYFSLKDEHSQVRCAMFRNRNRSLQFNPENGTSILTRASVSLYEDRGEFQLIIEHMEPIGDGALQRAYEELKQRLFNEGLFNEEHKLAIPSMANTIGVITSPTGAAIRDVLSILQRRFPVTKIILYPTAVQGEGAAEQVITMLDTAEQRKECDVLILTRGGGSLEDLRAFNNESLARAIFKCAIPIVTGIGHEIDFTIADFVADHRAATPSAAAELVSPDQIQLKQLLTEQNRKLLRLIHDKINNYKQNIKQIGKRLPQPVKQIQTFNQRLDGLYLHMQHLINYKLQHVNGQLSNLCRALDTVSPLATLNRGYAIVSKIENDKIVHNATQLNKGDLVQARFSKGRAHCTVDKIFNDDE